MQQWLRISLLVCIFGFFHEFRPSEPFVTEFLTGEWRNITSEQVFKEVYPLGTYSVLCLMSIVFLITDILRYKPIIVLTAVAGIILYALLLWTASLFALQITQMFYGLFMACEVAYYTYIYAKVDREHYQIVTGNTRAATLCGKFFAGIIAQILISTKVMNYRELNYITFGGQITSLFVAISLPSVQKSLYFYGSETTTAMVTTEVHKDNGVDISNVEASDNNIKPKPQFSWKRAIRLLREHIVTAFTNPLVVQLSLWWACATCGLIQVISYVQFLWKDIDPDRESIYNGGVEAAFTLLGAGGAMVAGFMNKNLYKRWHTWILTICALIMGIFMIVAAATNQVWVAYVMYVLFGIVYFFVITLVGSKIAENLPDDSFGLIFGINNLIATILQVIVTIVVVTDNGWGLEPRGQYYVYGGYFIGIAIIYLLFVVIRFFYVNSKCGGKQQEEKSI